MPRIVTVFRSGGEYRQEHVDRLRAQCAEHAPGVEFLCLDDAALEHDWPGWWAKMEIYRLSGPVLYMDLDTSVIGDLAPLLDAVDRHEFIALRDFNPKHREMGSGLMGWSGDLSRIYDAFCADPAAHMARCNTSRAWGDQGFVEPLTTGRAHWQDILPGAVVSWKKHCAGGVPADARVICFHGKPRPWEVGQ